TKERTSFKLPFPEELQPILTACIGKRQEGPLLRSRKAFEGGRRLPVITADQVGRLYEDKLARAPRHTILADQDRKEVFRRLLREGGGAWETQLAGEFSIVANAAEISADVPLYTLRSSVSTEMERANIRHLELVYLTSHKTNDILNRYVGLDPSG